MNLRRTALRVLERVEEGAYSNLALNSELKGVKDRRDRGLITELVYGVLRQKLRLDYLISQLAKRPLERIDRRVLTALRLGLYQLIFLDRIPARAAVNETVAALKGLTHRGGVGFANAVLRNYLRREDRLEYPDEEDEPLRYLTVFYSHPEWLVRLWLKRYGYNDTLRLMITNNTPAGLTIRLNELNFSREDILTSFTEDGVDLISTPVPGTYLVEGMAGVEKLPLYREGGFIVQGPGAALAGLILAPEPGDKVLDLAAGPGGKTTHLGLLMKNQGEITALDIYPHKLELIRENCQRLGVKIVRTVLADGREFQLPGREEKYDKILIDAPCSGLGLIRQKPEIKWNKAWSELRELREIQLELLANALTLLKRGGVLLYSTCALTAEENEGVVEALLERYGGELELLDLGPELDRLGLRDKFKMEQDGYLELFPPDSGTEGFFLAKFRLN